MSWPPTVTLPADGVTTPQTMLMRVVLPAPFGPRSAKISPFAISMSALFSAERPPAYVFERPWMERMDGRASILARPAVQHGGDVPHRALLLIYPRPRTSPAGCSARSPRR